MNNMFGKDRGSLLENGSNVDFSKFDISQCSRLVKSVGW